jgi:hypothetical protein
VLTVGRGLGRSGERIFASSRWVFSRQRGEVPAQEASTSEDPFRMPCGLGTETPTGRSGGGDKFQSQAAWVQPPILAIY